MEIKKSLAYSILLFELKALKFIWIMYSRKNSNFALGDFLFSCLAIQKTKSINLPFDSATKKFVEKNSGDGTNLEIICVRRSVQDYTLKREM